MDSEAVRIPVRILPADPNKFKSTYRPFPGGPVKYRALQPFTVHDLEGIHPEVEIEAGAEGEMAGIFEKQGEVYLRTVSSVNPSDAEGNLLAERFYGFPARKDLLWKVPTKEDDEDINYYAEEILENASPALRRQMLGTAGSVYGTLVRFIKGED